MLRHVVVFRWSDETDPAAIDALVSALAALPGLIPEVREYHFGRDLGLTATTGDFAVVAHFEDVEGFEAYRDHPAHRRIVTEMIEPMMGERVTVQFEHP